MKLKVWSLMTVAACALATGAYAVEPINSVNTGPVTGGTYFNTPGSRTTFENTAGTGLWLHSGTQVQGLEANTCANSTGNGGTVNFQAPGNVVRLDGNIDVSAIHNGNAYTGNGGIVVVDAANLFQNGHIVADSPATVNTTHDGSVISGGVYFNTADGMTSFTNSHNTGLWLQNGQNLRGLQVDALGNLTSNGGAFHLNAPGQVVRVDGNIDVRGLQNGQGAYLGHGGKVIVDAAYLFQNGNIYASGLNGGLVQFNVGAAASIAKTAQIETGSSVSGSGAQFSAGLSLAEAGPSAVLDSHGKIAGLIDTNVIGIQGQVVNRADNTVADNVEFTTGGTVRIVSSGQAPSAQTQWEAQAGLPKVNFMANAIALN